MKRILKARQKKYRFMQHPGLLVKVLNLSSKELNAHDPVSGLTPLAFALRGNHLDAVRLLLEAGAKASGKNQDGSCPLIDAVSENNVAAIPLLLRHGAVIDQKDGYGQTALQEATRRGYVDMIKLLLNSGADPNQVDCAGRTVFYDAIAMRQPSVITMLLERAFNIEHVDQYGITPFLYAVQLGYADEARILLDQGADRTHTSALTGTPIMLAAESGNMEILELLLPAEKQLIDCKNKGLDTALHLAAQNGHLAAVQALINAGADLNLDNRRGQMPLEVAARNGHVETVRLLLESEPKLSWATAKAEDLMGVAVREGIAAVVEFLLLRGIQMPELRITLANEPVTADLLRHWTLVQAGQADDAGDSLIQPGNQLMADLLGTAIRNKDAGLWKKDLKKHDVSATLSAALQSAAADARSVWKSLAGQGQKVSPAQQNNWCAGILADLGNTLLRELPYAKSGLTPATRTMLESIAAEQTQALATAAEAAEQPLREGIANLLQTCMKAVADDQFYPMDLFKLLTVEHGVYHNVASLIVSAFADVWPRRNSLGEVGLEQAFAEKLVSLKNKHKTLTAMHSDTANAGNLETVNMLMFRQLDLLQEWIAKALA